MYYIYKLVFKGESKFYIGQTKDVDKRYESHWSCLIRNQHHNSHLQNWFNKHTPSFMGMVILDKFENKCDCDNEEVRLINKTYDKNFNVSRMSGGGDLTSYHPNNKEIRKKIGDASKLLWSNPEYKERMSKMSRGEGNPNYKDGRTLIERSCYDCKRGMKSYYAVDKSVENILCTSCRSKIRTGDLNSFYGKTHTEETRLSMSKTTKARFLGGEMLSCARQLVADGKLFQSCSDCARFYGVNPSLITYRVKSEKWDYHYLVEDEDITCYEIMPRVLQKRKKRAKVSIVEKLDLWFMKVFVMNLYLCAQKL